MLPTRDRPLRDTELVCDLDDLLHLLGGGRRDRGMRLVAPVVVRNRVRVVIARDPLAGEDPVGTHDLPEAFQSGRHSFRLYAWGQRFSHYVLPLSVWAWSASSIEIGSGRVGTPVNGSRHARLSASPGKTGRI